jgi:hypothetical protein
MKNWIAAIALILSSAAIADTTFVNLADHDIRVARWFYTDGNSGNYNEPGWVFKGWTVVESGDAWVTDSKYLYIENRETDREIVYSNLKESTGYVKSGTPFEGFLPRGGDADSRLIDKGYKRVTFREFNDQTYIIPGDSYRLATKDIPFAYESRSVQFLREKFEVPGKVVDINYTQNYRGTKDIKWKIDGRAVFLNGSIEGKQTQAFGAREKGYYNGTLTVRYIARK